MRRPTILLAAVVAGLVAAAPASAATGLAGHWAFDEGSGVTTTDGSGAGNAGTLAGGVQWIAGKRLGALAFDHGGVQIADRSAYETPGLTVEAWVKAGASPGDYRYIVAKGASGCIAASYGLYTGPAGGIQFYVSSGGGSNYTRSPDGGQAIWDGQWHLVTGTFDGSAVRLYVDGTEVGSGSPASSPIDYGALDTRDLEIADYAGCGGLDYAGAVDDVRLYGRALTAAEVAQEPAFAFKGFFAPVDDLPTVNVVKAGSAVPVKFSLTGFQGLDGLMAPGSPSSQKVGCATNAPQDELESTATAGSSTLSYDPATDQYTYVWKTDKSWASTCRTLVVTLGDGVAHSATFRFK